MKLVTVIKQVDLCIAARVVWTINGLLITFYISQTFLRGHASKTDTDVQTLNTARGADGDSRVWRRVAGALMEYLRLIKVRRVHPPPAQGGAALPFILWPALLPWGCPRRRLACYHEPRFCVHHVHRLFLPCRNSRRLLHVFTSIAFRHVTDGILTWPGYMN